MTGESSNPILAGRVLEAFTALHGLAYAEIDPNLVVRRVSDNLTALLGDQATDAVGTPLSELLLEFVGSEPLLEQVLAGEMPRFEIERINRDDGAGGVRYLSYQVLPLDEAEPGRGLLLVIEDVTEGCRLEQRLVQDRNELRLLQRRLAAANDELTRLSRFKSFLLSMAAHDLRSSLSAISGYAELLLDDSDGMEADEKHEFIGIIRAQAYQLSRLLTSLLDLDQIEQDKLVISHEPCDMNALLFEVVGSLEPAAQLQEVDLSLELPDETVRIMGDSSRVLQIAHNLLSNGIKYTPSGGAVRCTLERVPESDEVILRVSDTGYGMSEEQQAELFQLYYRTDEARRSKIRGTGLGLFIVRTLVEAHDGRIEVESAVGEGSVFSVYLPVGEPMMLAEGS